VQTQLNWAHRCRVHRHYELHEKKTNLANLKAGLPDCSRSKHTKTGKNTKCPNMHTKWPQNIPHHHKIFHMTTKYSTWPQIITTFSILRPSKIYPNCFFGIKTNHLATLPESVRSSDCRTYCWDRYQTVLNIFAKLNL
jgi:hypothetical protein